MRQWLMLIGAVVGIVLASLTGTSLLLTRHFLAGGIAIAFAIYLSLGFRTVQPEERRVVEFFGGYFMTLWSSPRVEWFGLRWILPWAMNFRASIRIAEQRIDLFEEPIKIDFRDGSAIPKGAEAWVRVKNPDTRYPPPGRLGREMTGVERAIYEIGNWRIAIKDLLENALRSYLNTLTIDQGITRARAGFDLRNRLPKAQRGRLEETLARWGFELMQVTIMDFDLEPELVRARGAVQIKERTAEASRHEAIIRARETTGTLIAMMAEYLGLSVKEVQARIGADPALQARLQDFVEDLVSRQVSIAGKALTDIRVSGAGDLGNALMALITAIKKA